MTTIKKLQRGQSLVEMALSMTVMLMIMLGLFDFGRLYFTYLALEDSAGEAALYLSIYPACGNALDGAECANPNNATYRALNAVGGQLDWNDVVISIDTPAPLGVGEVVKVTMSYDYEMMTPIMPQLSTIRLSSTAIQTVITE